MIGEVYHGVANYWESMDRSVQSVCSDDACGTVLSSNHCAHNSSVHQLNRRGSCQQRGVAQGGVASVAMFPN